LALVVCVGKKSKVQSAQKFKFFKNHKKC